jgi:hypothetical protein
MKNAREGKNFGKGFLILQSTAQELVARLPSKAKWIIGFVVLLSGTIVAVCP